MGISKIQLSLQKKKPGCPGFVNEFYMVRNVRSIKPKRYNRLAANASSAS